MKILVTGAAGFIGFHTARRLLQRGDDIVGFDNVNDYYDVRVKRHRIERMLGREAEIVAIANRYYKKRNFLFLGRGINYPIALEGSLKLKEISYIHADAYPSAEMKHGPIALITPDFPSLFVVPRDTMFDKNMSNIEEIKARKGRILAVATEGDREITTRADDVLYVPPTIDCLQPLLTVVPLQLLAYHIAVLRGCDVDKPRNLAKSVTVE